jgi:hypothetical protein
MSEIYIHIGYAKAASTTLQKCLFSKHPDINYLGLLPTNNVGIDVEPINWDCIFLSDSLVRRFYNNIVQQDSLQFLFDKNNDFLLKNLKSKFHGSKINLLSHEGLSDTYSADRGVKAERLYRLFPTAKIIIIIRNQYDIIKSQYRDHPFNPLNRDFGAAISLEDWLNICIVNQNKISFLPSLNYYEVYKYYEKLFGKTNIKVLVFEDLLRDDNSFTNKLSCFMGIDKEISHDLLNSKIENIGVSARFNRYRKIRRSLSFKIPFRKILSDKFCNSIESFLKKGRKDNIVMGDKVKGEILDFYKKSNIELGKELHIDFKSYEYPI